VGRGRGRNEACAGRPVTACTREARLEGGLGATALQDRSGGEDEAWRQRGFIKGDL